MFGYYVFVIQFVGQCVWFQVLFLQVQVYGVVEVGVFVVFFDIVGGGMLFSDQVDYWVW